MPRARSDRIIGGGRLRISSAALPVDNAADETLLRLLAKAWRSQRNDPSIAFGAPSRNKIVHSSASRRRCRPDWPRLSLHLPDVSG